ncbi:MAG: hypothetical protein HFE73_01165 [Firmicutes bacterium]|nr:hypothetical protein [Bacillota bacterium]
MELRMHTFSNKSEGITAGKVIAKNILKNVVGGFGINLDISDNDLQEIYKSVDLSGKLLVLEDLERSNIDIVKVLGFVNGLVERDGVKVLLVANENEIIKREQDENKTEKIIAPEKIKQYIRIKEKTISDTIHFSIPLNNAIKNIVESFDKCIFWGILSLASKIKTENFPKWGREEHLSIDLGTYDMPLMRFAYDYIRWQTLDLGQMADDYEAYKRYRYCESKAEYRDTDFKTLGDYFIETEKNIVNALKNIESRLENSKDIGIYAYRKLAY